MGQSQRSRDDKPDRTSKQGTRNGKPLRERAGPARGRVGTVVQPLHRALGNRTVQTLVQTGRLGSPLESGRDDDSAEREAARVASQVDRVAGPERQSPQTRSRDGASGKGRPLDDAVVESMASLFGRDFSHVRVHTDQQTATAAAALNAKAYTVGRDIFFGSGQYDPETRTGLALLAHELTHVVQQSRGGPRMQYERDYDRGPDGNGLGQGGVRAKIGLRGSIPVNALVIPISLDANTSGGYVKKYDKLVITIEAPGGGRYYSPRYVREKGISNEYGTVKAEYSVVKDGRITERQRAEYFEHKAMVSFKSLGPVKPTGLTRGVPGDPGVVRKTAIGIGNLYGITTRRTGITERVLQTFLTSGIIEVSMPAPFSGMTLTFGSTDDPVPFVYEQQVDEVEKPDVVTREGGIGINIGGWDPETATHIISSSGISKIQ